MKLRTRTNCPMSSALERAWKGGRFGVGITSLPPALWVLLVSPPRDPDAVSPPLQPLYLCRYLPLAMLMQPHNDRATHLHFDCQCTRCAAAMVESVGAHAERTSWPAGFAATSGGKAVAAFKLAAAAGAGLGASAEAVLELGRTAIGAASDVLSTAQYPLATLDLCLLYLGAFWQAPESRGAVYAGAAARLCLDAVSALAADAGTTPASIPVAAVELLGCCVAVTAYVVPGAWLREHSVPALLSALQRLRAAYGGSFDFIRDDLPIAADLANPNIKIIADGIDQTAADTVDFDIAGLDRDHCGGPGCLAQEEVGIEFKRCARCKAVKYCGAACQKAAWGFHKPFCPKH
jgi:hypothetical protein